MVDVSIEGDFEEVSREVADEAANRWFSWSQEDLYKKGDRFDYDVSSVAQSGQPPQWSEGDGGFVFTYDHHAAPFFEMGAKEYEIEAQEAEFLAFEWEDAPPEVEEMFSDTYPTVFFKSVNHPGMPELRYLRDSRERVRTWLRNEEVE